MRRKSSELIGRQTAKSCRWVAVVLGCAVLAACAVVPASEMGSEMASNADPAEVPMVALTDDPGMEASFVPSLAARPGRPCGDIVGLAMSGPFTAAVVQLGEASSLTDATPEMIACAETNDLEVTFTSGG